MATPKVLMCSDGSKQSDAAVRFGAHIAAALQAEVTLFGIVEKAAEREGAIQTMRQEEAIIASLRRGQQLLAEGGVKAELVTKAGDPVEEIVRRTRESGVPYDLVVLGAVKKPSQGLFLKSGIAYRIIRSVEPPVLVVIGERPAVRSILFASGAGGKDTRVGVEFTARLAKACGASVTLFHVLAEPPAVYADLIRLEEDSNIVLYSNSALSRSLLREKAAFDAAGVAAEIRLAHGILVDEVMEEARRGNHDIIVTGSQPVGLALRTYILGNITREVVNQAEIPVLVVRYGASATARWSFREVLARLFGRRPPASAS